MGVCWNWVSFVRAKFSKSQATNPINENVNDHRSTGEDEDGEDSQELIAETEETNVNDDIDSSSACIKREYSAVDIAAIKIQASYRGCLARRAFRALRSIVKLQALVRGVQVRRQSRIALHCMHALVRLQVSVRTRQLLRN